MKQSCGVQGSESGEGIFGKLKGSMDKARMMGSKVVPRFGPDREHMAQVSPPTVLCDAVRI